MRLMTLIRSCSLPFAILLCWSLIGLWLPQPVNAQTNTPSINTPTPGASTPTPYGWDENVIALNFAFSEQFFDLIDGVHTSGQGFQSVGGELHINGNDNEYGPVTKVQLRYTASASGSIQIVFNYDGVSQDAILVNFSTCLNCSNIIITLDNIIIDNFDIEVTTTSLFTLHEMSIYAFTGESAPPTPVVVGGCPILTTEQIVLLDPVYRSNCARCFITPTPVRENSISTKVIAVSTQDLTLQGTFQVPVIVSGTPMTPTPGGIAIGNTATPAPTNTPLFTATPSYVVYTYNFESGVFPAGWEYDTYLSGGVAFNYGLIGAGGVRSVYVGNVDGVGFVNRQRVSVRGEDLNLTNVVQINVKFNNSAYDLNSVNVWLSTGGVYALQVSANPSVLASNNEWVFGSISPPRNFEDVDLYIDANTAQVSGFHYLKEIQFVTNLVAPTPTPTSTPTPTATGAAWFPTLDPSESECSVPQYRDDTPIVDVPIMLNPAGYSCYTLVPDMTVAIPGRGTLGIDGLQLCVDWVEFPHLQILSITIALDWVLVAVLATMIRYLLNF